MHRHHRFALLLLCVCVPVTLVLTSSAPARGRHIRHAAPVRKKRPRISGTPQVGQVLRAYPGKWSSDPQFRYRWERCNARGKHCRLIKRRRHAKPRRYTLSARDLGHTIRVIVVATNRWGSASASSRVTRVIRRRGSSTPVGVPVGTTPAPPPPTPNPTPLPSTGPSGPTGLHIASGQLLDGSGNVVHIHGVNISGTEYACIQGNGIWDDSNPSSPPPTIPALQAWHVNFVRVLLNEDCWLGINGTGVSNWSADSGANYRTAIVNWVNQLHQAGIYTEIVDMWNAPGANKATYQDNAVDEDHSPAMWASMAQTFAGDPDTILSPTGETTVSLNCEFNGCPSAADPGEQPQWGGSYNYISAGYDQAVQVIRLGGFSGPIALECQSYANLCDNGGGSSPDTDSWLYFAQQIHDSQIMAEVHLYGGNGCDTTSCMNTQYLPVIRAGYPLFLGETGERYDFSDCPSTSYISQFIPWMDQNGGTGYMAWTWDTWGACATGALITDWNGSAQTGDGQYIQSYYTTHWPADP